jgi:hypothetical protein
VEVKMTYKFEKLEQDYNLLMDMEELFNKLNYYYEKPEDKFSDVLGGLSGFVGHQIALLKKNLK